MTAPKRLGLLVAFSVVFAGCQTGTRSTEPDLDADGLPDAVEQEGWNLTVRRAVATCFSNLPQPEETRMVGSNEALTDTDNDGVDDFWEFQLRSDPQDNDTDDDGLSDREELDLHESPDLYAGPLLRLNDADSDDDCLPDGQEVAGFVIPGVGLRTTDPTFANTDGDGWIDPFEVQRSHTDPRSKDTDGDGAEDHFDVDPLRDVWLRFDLLRILVKQSPTNSQRLDVLFDWFVPTSPPTVRPTPRPHFNLRVGEDTTVPANNTPGLVNLDDNQGGPLVEFSLAAFYYDAAWPAKPLEINPHDTDAAQPVTSRYNVVSGAWSFRDQDGGWTPEGTTAKLETAKTRVVFALAAQGPP